jgi:phosphoglycolate phosphatase
MKLQDKKLILFDLDGTLIDSIPDLCVAMSHTLTKLNMKLHSEDEIREWVGNGLDKLVRRSLLGKKEIDGTLDEELVTKAKDIFNDYYENNLTKHTKIYDGVEDTLKALKQKGYKLVVVSNKPEKFVGIILDDLGWDSIFDTYVGGDTTPQLKPDPAPLLFVCKKLDIEPKDTIMVGDSNNDLVSANNANIDSIGVTYGYNYGEDLSIYSPKAVVKSFSNIKELLSN